jgi:hypothetical protein
METWPKNSRGSGEQISDVQKKNFEETVALDTPLSVKEVVRAIAAYHETSESAVLDAFLNLRQAADDDIVTLSDSVSNGDHCLKVEIQNKAMGTRVFSLIDSVTGHPIAHIA